MQFNSEQIQFNQDYNLNCSQTEVPQESYSKQNYQYSKESQQQDQSLKSQDNKIIKYRQPQQQVIELLRQNRDTTIQKKNLKNCIKNQNSISNINLQTTQNKAYGINQTEQYEFKYDVNDEQELESDNLNSDKKINNTQENHTQKEIIDQLFNNTNIRYNYQSTKYKIYQELLKKNYKLTNYLDSGGQSDIFDGYFQNVEGEKEQYVFKIYYDTNNDEFQKEIEIMKSFQIAINIVNIIDSFQIEKFFIVVLEKCQYSLKQELQLFKERKQPFSFDQLLQIIFDLLDGLIQFRVYNILHLDIKPGNILLSNDGEYCFSDFGASFNTKKNKEIDVQYYTKAFAPPEQIEKIKNQQSQKSVDFKSDVYSLGKTLKQIIGVFKGIHFDDNLQNHKNKRQIIENFEKIIDKNMIQDETSQRQQCQSLHEQFLRELKVEDYQQFFLKYQIKVLKLIHLYEYDQNKDIPYFQQLKLQYNLINLNLIKNGQNQNLYENIKKYLEKQQFQIQPKQNGLDSLEPLEMNKQIFQENHHLLSKSLNNVVQCYTNLGDYKMSLKYQLEALEVTKQIFQGDHPEVSTSLSNVGSIYLKLGDYTNSLKYCLDSLKARKQVVKENYGSIASTLDNVGLCCLQLGDSKNGLHYFQKAFGLRQQIFQGNHEDITRSLNLIGQCYNNLADYQNGMKYQLQSLQMRKQLYQGIHPDIALSISNVGLCYNNLGNYQTALKFFLESFEMFKQIYQGNHPSIATFLNNVGLCYKDLGDSKNSLKYSLKSLEMAKQIYQEIHPDIPTHLNNLGECYKNLGENKKGLKHLLESLLMAKQIFEGNHPSIATALNNIAQSYRNLGQKQNSLKYQLKSLKMMKQIYQGNHTSIATTINNVGSIYIDLGDFQNGLKYILESLNMMKQIIKGNHPSIVQLLTNVGECYNRIGDKQNGMKYLQESQEMKQQLLRQNQKS